MEELIRLLIKEGRMLYRGAEAVIYLVDYIGENSILKRRVGKKYRDPHIDSVLVRSRTYKEAAALKIAEDLSIPAPKLYYASIRDGVLIMSYIEGVLLRDALIKREISDDLKRELFIRIGGYLAKLHNNKVTHGDLTTSNIILTSGNEVYLIDFGLTNLNSSYEEMSVDVEMFERVLISTHSDEADELFKLFMEGYVSNVINPDEVLRRYNFIKRSGRYHAIQG